MEVRFAELERDPLRTLRRIYDSLSLGGFEQVQPLFERYIAGLEMRGFRKNAHRWDGPHKWVTHLSAVWQVCRLHVRVVQVCAEVVMQPWLLILCCCCPHGLPPPAPPHLHQPPSPLLHAGA